MVRNIPSGRFLKGLTHLLPVELEGGEGFGFLQMPNIFMGLFSLWNHFPKFIPFSPPPPHSSKRHFLINKMPI